MPGIIIRGTSGTGFDKPELDQTVADSEPAATVESQVQAQLAVYREACGQANYSGRTITVQIS